MKPLIFLFFLGCSTICAQNWTTSSTQQADVIGEISVVNNDVIWLTDQTAPKNGFSISTDGGQTWTHKNFPTFFMDNNFSLGVLSAVDAYTAYVIVSSADIAGFAGLYKTTNAGNTWFRETGLFNGARSFPNQVHFWDANRGFAMGDGLELYEYSFGVWNDKSGNIASIGTWSLNSSDFLKVTRTSAYFLTGAGTIIYTNDLGYSWNEITTPFNSQSNVNFSFKDNLNGIVVFNDNTSNQLYSTSDGGQTWNLVGNNIANLNHVIEYVPSENRYYSKSRNPNNLQLSYSEDNGTTWTNQPAFGGMLLGEIETSVEGKVFIGAISNVHIKTLDFSNHPDLGALTALYNSLNGNQWTNNANWLDTTKAISSWHGVTETNGRVSGIDLENNNVTGSIPTEIENLTELERFYIEVATLTGGLPTSIGNLGKLRELILYRTGLSGNIPASIVNCTNLEWLTLTDNQLYGDIPDLTGLANLHSLFLNFNFFQFGDIEDEFAAYQNRIGINFGFSPQNVIQVNKEDKVVAIGDDLSFNSYPITGNNNVYNWYLNNEPIDPATNTNITGLNTPNIQIDNMAQEQLGTYECRVTNTVVTGLILTSGILNVGISPELHQDYDALVSIYTALNGQNWYNNTNWLDSSKPINSWFGISEKNGRVSGLELIDNNTIGTFPQEIASLTELETLWILQSHITGELPSDIGNLAKLRELILYHTYGITGNIPASIQNCSNLEWLNLSNNQFKGTIPDLSGLNKLNNFVIENNNFQFGDFENEFADYQNNMSYFVYSPQNNVGEEVNAVLNVGESETLNTVVSGSQNNYDWYRINADGSDGGYISSGPTITVTINSTNDYKWYYYYLATSPLVPGLALRSSYFKFSEDPTTSPDYDALVALYNSTNGDNWIINTNWLDPTQPLSTWWGIQHVENNRVTNIDFGINNLTGTLPEEIGDFTELTHLVLLGNDISGEIPNEIWDLTKMKMLILGGQQSAQLTLPNGIPTAISAMQDLEWLNLTGVPLTQPLQPELFKLPNLVRLRVVECGLSGSLPKEFGGIQDVLAYGNEFEGPVPPEVIHSTINDRLSIANNYFNFNDLEPLLAANNRSFLDYSPQRTKDITENLEFPPGEDITMSVDDTRFDKAENYKATENVYQWFKDDMAINNATSSAYTITDAQETDSGTYFCEITNNLVPNLVIKRANITLLIDASLSNQTKPIDNTSIYPNPAKDVIHVNFDNVRNTEVTFFDLHGRLVFKKELFAKNNVLDISNFSNGIYVLKLKSNNTILTKSIIKK